MSSIISSYVYHNDEPNWTWYEGTGLENPKEIIEGYVVKQAAS